MLILLKNLYQCAYVLLGAKKKVLLLYAFVGGVLIQYCNGQKKFNFGNAGTQ